MKKILTLALILIMVPVVYGDDECNCFDDQDCGINEYCDVSQGECIASDGGIGRCLGCLNEGDLCDGSRGGGPACCDMDCTSDHCCPSGESWDGINCGPACSLEKGACTKDSDCYDGNDLYCTDDDKCCEVGAYWGGATCIDSNECTTPQGPCNVFDFWNTCINNDDACCNQGLKFGDPEWYEWENIVVY